MEEAGSTTSSLSSAIAAAHEAPSSTARQLGRRPVKLDGRVERLEQRKAADVADEDGSAGRECGDRALEHAHEILGAREVLHHRVQHHRVEGAVRGRGVVGQALEQPDLREIGGGDRLAESRDDIAGEVGAPVLLAVRSQPQQQQPGATTDLEHPTRCQRSYPAATVVATHSAISAAGIGSPE